MNDKQYVSKLRLITIHINQTNTSIPKQTRNSGVEDSVAAECEERIWGLFLPRGGAF